MRKHKCVCVINHIRDDKINLDFEIYNFYIT